MICKMPCHDCGVDTHIRNEYYMVYNDIWETVAKDVGLGFLCIGCLEKRLKRKLNSADFTHWPVNSYPRNCYSIRLWRRLHERD